METKMSTNLALRLTTLIALGTLAGAAAAQSSVSLPSGVTLYGIVDLSMHYLRSGDQSALGGKTFTRLSDGTVYGPGSRWGFRISEDLGNGLKMGALLESGFMADTGSLAQGGRLFGRQIYLIVSSTTAGELRLGRQYMLHDEVFGVVSPAAGFTITNPGGIYTLPSGTIQMFIDANRIDNAVHYLSPTVNGFRIQGMVAPGEGSQDLYKALKGSYINGPFTTAAAFEQSQARVVLPGATSSVNKIAIFGANYNFGAVRLYGGVQQGRDLTTGVGTQLGTLNLPGLPSAAVNSRAYNVAASKQIDATHLMVNYTRSKFFSESGAEVTLGRLGIAATYSLSKQSAVVAAFTVANGSLKGYVSEKQLYQLGLRKLF
jgi:GBP family porin